MESKLASKLTPLHKAEDAANSLIKYLSDKKVVLLGEASHGTQEYYNIRRLITEKLIKDHNFNFVAVEGDWPECYGINKYIKNEKSNQDPLDVLKSFKRWPTWMWSNQEVLKLMSNLKEINKNREKKHKASVYGLDVYSLFESIDQVIKELGKVDPQMGELARYRYSCFDRFNKDEKKYLNYLVAFPQGCREGVINVLKDVLKLRLDNIEDSEDEVLFNIKQNAQIVLNAESYYRTMIFGDENSWNVRDRHMMDTLDTIFKSLKPDGKAIIWAHNTHIGDYKYTSMVDEGEVNIGGLAREKYGEDNVALVGFGTHRGSVIASNKWGGKIKKLPVPSAMHGSYDDLFHNLCVKMNAPMCSVNFSELKKKEGEEEEFLKMKGQRAIGVVYHPAYERGNYVPTVLCKRYDAFIFVDQTNALEPIIVTKPEEKEIPHDFGANEV
jgi:erythromycin esterase